MGTQEACTETKTYAHTNTRTHITNTVTVTLWSYENGHRKEENQREGHKNEEEWTHKRTNERANEWQGQRQNWNAMHRVFVCVWVCEYVCFKIIVGNCGRCAIRIENTLKPGTHSRVIRNAVSLAFIALLCVRVRVCVYACVCVCIHSIYAYFKSTMSIGMQNNEIYMYTRIDSEHFKNVNNKNSDTTWESVFASVCASALF